MTSPTPSLRVGAYAVCLRDGAVLLARLTGTDPRWTLPGGGLDHGEDRTRYIHLSYARVLLPGDSSQSTAGMHWRRRLSEVSGWSFGHPGGE